MNQKIRVALLFGGQSAEHEISVQSAKNVLAALNRDRYEPVLVGIDLDGGWHTIEEAFLREAPQGVRIPSDGPRLAAIPGAGKRFLIPAVEQEALSALASEIDVALPILHGPHGEDGTIQGLLKLAGVPFVGCGVLGSAVGMDKDAMKRLLRDAGLPVGRFLSLTRQAAIETGFETIASNLGTPFFVKPANLGSSVGIHKVRDAAEWEASRADALRFDHKLLVEEFIDGREIEVAVLGNGPYSASVAGEIIPAGDFYDYDSKYLSADGARLEIPARLSETDMGRFKSLAVKTCEALYSRGLARVDFFLRRRDGAIFVNEINTFPGFTRVSMFPKLWEASGLSYPELIDRLVALALENWETDARLENALPRR